MKTFLRVIVVVTPLFLSGCVNIQGIHTFAETSLTSLNNYQDLPYSFSKHCQDLCLTNAIKTYSIMRSNDCDCKIYGQADSISLLIATRLSAYFTGLLKISGNENTTISFAPVHTTLSGKSFGKTDAEGKFHGIRIEPGDADAIDTLTTTISNAFLDVYKRNKLKLYLKSANPSVQILLSRLKYIQQSNLLLELSFRKEELYAHYREMILNGGLSSYEKEQLTRDYYQLLNDANNKQAHLKIFASSLDTIAKCHQKLFESLDKLSKSDVKIFLATYSTSLMNLSAAFNKLQK